MELRLSDQEYVIKTYNYAYTYSSNSRVKGYVNNSLIVTNRRLVQENANGSHVERREMPIEAAKYINYSYTSVKKSLSLTLTVIFTLIAVAALAALYPLWLYNYDIPLVACAAGAALSLLITIICLGRYIRGGYQNTLTIEISSDLPPETMMEVSTKVSHFRKSLKKPDSKKVTGISITVDRAVAYQMVNELGALLLDIRANRV